MTGEQSFSEWILPGNQDGGSESGSVIVLLDAEAGFQVSSICAKVRMSPYHVREPLIPFLWWIHSWDNMGHSVLVYHFPFLTLFSLIWTQEGWMKWSLGPLQVLKFKDNIILTFLYHNIEELEENLEVRLYHLKWHTVFVKTGKAERKSWKIVLSFLDQQSSFDSTYSAGLKCFCDGI